MALLNYNCYPQFRLSYDLVLNDGIERTTFEYFNDLGKARLRLNNLRALMKTFNGYELSNVKYIFWSVHKNKLTKTTIKL